MTAPAPGTLLAGKYRLERPLAQGGMGSVWVAFDLQLEVPVAVKLMAPALAGSPELVSRFEREAKAAAQLRSPHVVQVFEYGVDGAVPYIAMELLEGEDLGTRLKRRGRVSLPEAAEILGPVCKALRRAHEAGIVHRDLKPANIFLARHDEDEIVKVLDFGIAKSAQPSPTGEGTRTGLVMGSPSYMSPEQVRSTKNVDHRSDLWSLGLVMFRTITGRPAFVGESDADVIVKLCADAVPVPSAVAPDLPHEIDAFFERALRRNPDERFQSAREMAAAFSRIAGRVPSLAEPWTSGSREAAPVPMPAAAREPTVELTAGDIVRTAPPEALPRPRVEEPTMKLAADAYAYPAPPPEAPAPQAPVAPSGATLTNAGNVTLPVHHGAGGWLVWGVGAVAAALVIAVAVVLGTGVARRGREASAGATTPAATASASAPAVVVASAQGSAEASASAARGGEIEPVPEAAGTASAATSAAKEEPPRVGRRPAVKLSVTAKPAAGGLPAIPRVLGQGSKR